MFRSTPRHEEEKERDVQVEVSLDIFEKLCSIVVTEDKNMQTVVAVPSESGAMRHRFFRKNKMNDLVIEGRHKKELTTPGRLADSLRPLSPTPKDRHLDSDARSSRGRGRTISHSCPPPLSRAAERVDLSDQRGGKRIHREQSCPPVYNRQSSDSSTRTSRRTSVRSTTGKGLPPKKSKDLVSTTATRNRLFGSMRKSGKVIPVPPSPP